MGTMIKPNGEITEFNDFSVDGLQTAVEGYFELIYLNEEYVMVVNEEGKILDLPYNSSASAEAGFPVYGTVVITRLGDLD